MNGTFNSASLAGEDSNGNMALVRDYGKVRKVTDKIMLGYDDIYSIQYFGTNLRSYWNSRGDRTIESEMLAAYNEYDELLARCYAFDKS